MRVLLISHTCQSRTEGQPRAAQLALLPDVDLRVLVPNRWFHYGRWRGADESVDEGLTVEVGRVALPWTGPGKFYLHWYPGLAPLLRTFRPDVIDLWEEPWSLVSAHASWLRNRLLPKAKMVSETEQNLNKRLPPPFAWFRQYSLANADYAVARNREAIDVMRSQGYAGPAEVVPNAVNTDLFRPLDRLRCRKEWGLTGFVVGYVGRLVPEKGLDDLVDAVGRCGSDVTLLCVGDGPETDTLRQRAKALGAADRVRILPAVPFAKLPGLMNAIDCLALPSRTTPRWKEQFGRVIIEAHACGTPVIGSNSGAIPDVVGGGGLVVPERDPAALAAGIDRLANDPLLCRRLGDAGRAAAIAKYTWRRVANQMYGIYRRVLDGDAGSLAAARGGGGGAEPFSKPSVVIR